MTLLTSTPTTSAHATMLRPWAGAALSEVEVWMNIDPIEHYYQSPYVGFDSNPVFYADPTGTSSIKLEGQAAQDFFGALKDEVANKRTDEYRKYFQQVQEDVANADMSMSGGGEDPKKSYNGPSETGCPEPCPWGTITERPTTWVDTWAESSNIFAQASYEIVNSFSIVGQSLNPFDNQVTTLTGEGLNGTDRSAHGANVAATLLPIGGASGLKYSSSLLKISNPNALTRSLPGFTDKVSGSVLRQGRGPLIDYPTKKPALRSLNSQKLNKYGQWATGIGLSGAASYYYYKKAIQKK